MFRHLCLVAVLLLGWSAAADVIAEWNFNNTAAQTTPSAGTGTLGPIGGITVSAAGSGVGSSDPETAAGADNAYQSTGYPAASVGDRTAGIEVATSTVGYKNVKFSFDYRGSNTSSRRLAVLYSLDGANFLEGAVVEILAGGLFTNGITVDFSAVAAANDNPTFKVRVVSTFADGTAYAAVSGNYGTAGTARIDMVSVTGDPLGGEPKAPNIFTQPLSRTNFVGSTASFAVAVNGTAPLTFTWEKDNGGTWQAVDGGTAAALTLANVQFAAAGTYRVRVTNAQGAVTSDPVTLTVQEDPANVVSTIAQLRAKVDPATLVPSDTTAVYKVEGIVTTHINITTAGNHFFYIQDATGGIGVFVSGANGEVPPAGADLRVTGPLGHFNGLLMLGLAGANAAHKVEILSTGNPLPTPTPLNYAWPTGVSAADDVNVLDAEANEAKLVIASNVVIDPSSGPTFTSGSNVIISDAADPTKTFTLRIDSRVIDIIGQQKPTGPATIVGVLGQFDGSDPRAGGYQLLPTRFADIESAFKAATIRFTNTLSNLVRPGDQLTNTFAEHALRPGESIYIGFEITDPENRPVTVTLGNAIPAGAEWSFGSLSGTKVNGAFRYTATAAAAGQAFDVAVTADNGATSFTQTIRLYVPTVAEQQVVITEFYANPASTNAVAWFNPLNRVELLPGGTDASPANRDEFVELVNLSGESIDLTGWMVSDALLRRAYIYPGTAGTTLAPSNSLIVYGGPAFGYTPQLSVPAIAAEVGPGDAFSTAGLALNDGGDTIILRNAQSNIISRILYAQSQTSTNGSLVRFPTDRDGFVAHSGTGERKWSPGIQFDGLSWSAAGVMEMTKQDADFLLVRAGSRLAFTNWVVRGAGYQWRKDTVAIAGETGSSLIIASANLSDAGAYQLLASRWTNTLLTPATLVGVYTAEVVGSGEILAESVGAGAAKFTARASAGFKLDHWEGEVAGTALQQTVTFTEAKPACRLKVVFVPAQSVAVAPTVEGVGLVLGGGTYDERASVTLRAVPQVDWKFDHWEGVAAELATSNPATVEAAIGLRPIAVFEAATGNGRFYDGTVVAWGENLSGQATVPDGLNGVVAVAASSEHTVALKSDGTVVAWGWNSEGQTTVPAGLSGVVAIAASSEHTVALKSDGTVVAWGRADWGQTTVPDGLNGVVAIAAGGEHNVALKSDGTVVAWGRNGWGQTTVPAGLSGVVAIAAVGVHTVALKSDGTVVAWGNNGEGQTTVPAGLSGVTAIAAGGAHTVALKSDGTVVAWGWNSEGQTTVPAGLSGVVAVAAHSMVTVALKSDGTVVAWGNNGWGQTTVPAGLSGVTAIAAGGRHTAALRSSRLCLVGRPSKLKMTEVGEPISLAPQLALANRFQWYRGGQPIPDATSAQLDFSSAQLSDSGSYQLLAQNDTEALLTPPIEVRVVPEGYPRVLVNGAEVQTSTRQGDSAEVRLMTTLANGQLFYTLDGPEPSLESTRYAGPFVVTNTVVVRALALSGDFTQEASSDPVSIQIVPTYALTTAVTGNGRVERSPALARYLEDDVVIVRAVADAGWRFVRWEDDLSGSFPERNVAMGRNKSVRAVFEAIPAHEIILRFAGYHVNPNLDTLRPGEVVRTIVGGISDGRPIRIVYYGRDLADGPPTQRMTWTETVTDVSGGTRVFESPTGWRDAAQTALLNVGTPVSRLEGDRFSVAGPEIPWEFAINGISSGTYSLGRLTFIYAFQCDGQSGQGETIPPGCQAVWGWNEFNTFTSGGIKSEIRFGSPPAHIGLAVGSSPALEGSVIQVVTDPKPGWSFLGWSGDHAGVETNFSWVVDGPATFEANFGTTMSTLATGPGRVVLEPELAVYPYGSQVKVIPVPDAGNYLALWGEAGAGQPKTEWVLTVTNATPRVTALFRALASDRVALNVKSTLGGRVMQPNADGLYAKDDVVTLTAVPESGYEFIGWSGDASGTATEVTLTLATSKTVRAEFRRVGVASFALTVTVAGPGTVRRVPDLGAYEAGSEVELVAEPTGDAVFQGWGGALSSPQRRVRLTVSGPTAVTATFLPVHPVATEVRGEGQVLLSPPEGSYAAGTVLALTAKPAEGWGFVQWIGDVTTTGQEATLTVDAPKRVIAEFARLGTLTTKVQGQGSIARTPDAASYLPGTAVTLKANPVAGWKFVRWTGGATGTGAQLPVTVGRTEAIVAEFADAEGPAVTLTEPVNGTVTDERFALRGTVADNVGVNAVNWSWNGIGQGALSLADGAFAVPGLTLKPGSNLLGVSATDAAGNVTTVNREVMWTPVRTLAVGTAPEVQEGRRLVYPVSLTAPGDVAGLTFRLNYDPDYLTDPQVEWGSMVGQSVNTLNLTTNGQIWAAFSLGGTALPAGTQRVADVSFRARSVPALRSEPLTPVLVSVGALDGATLSPGNAAVAGEGRIKPRRITGDINANQRVDIGDAVLLSRLQVGLEELRPWDVALNDLNGSAQVDNGDVIRALRIVVGLDLPPTPSAGVARAGLARAALNTNDTVTLEFPDGPAVRAGAPWRVVVRLDRAGGSLSGMSLKVRYPSGLSLAEKRGGALIPGDAPVLWNEEADGVRMAAMRATPWPGSCGEAAVLTFLPGPGPASGGGIEVVAGELSGAGFDVMEMDSVTATVTAENTAPVLGNVADTEVPEHGVLSRQLEATDAEASQTLTYALVSGPEGLTVGGNGAVAWTPTETQGPSTNVVVMQVTDDGEPPLSATNRFTVIVREVNSAPAFAGLTNATIPELVLYAQTLAGADGDVPEQTLSFSLVSGPAGAGVTNGVFGWVPGEAQGPSTNEVTVAVSDGVASVTNAFTVIVTEVNVAPVLAAVADRTVDEGTLLSLSLAGSDADVPAQTLTYALVSGPVGLTVGGTGAVAWTPTETRGPSTNTVVVQVNDGSLTAERTFSVVVRAVNVAPPGADGKLTLEVTAGPGEEVIVETTTDLTAWTETQRVTGQGGGTPVRVTVTPQAGVEARFWRVRRP